MGVVFAGTRCTPESTHTAVCSVPSIPDSSPLCELLGDYRSAIALVQCLKVCILAMIVIAGIYIQGHPGAAASVARFRVGLLPLGAAHVNRDHSAGDADV